MMIFNRKLFSILTLLLAFLSCNGPANKRVVIEKTDQDVFFEHFMAIEGKRFQGTQVFISDNMESWEDLEIVMYVREFHPDAIYIPLRVGENTSRTWALYRDNNGRLRFRHDHRHADGTPENLSLYGGYHAQGSTAFKQIFPADEYTCNMAAAICDNEWTLSFNEDLSGFSYILKKAGEKVFQLDFDLTRELR